MYKILLMIFRTFSTLCVIVAVAAATAHISKGQSRFEPIDFPEAASTVALDIDPSGRIVGEYKSADGVQHGFLLSKGRFFSIDYPDANWTQAWGINPRGDIVGQYKVAGDANIHGFIYRDGQYFNIDIDANANTMPLKISPEGTIVGCFHTAAFMYGFIMDDKGVIIDQMEIGVASMQTGIAASGVIVGNFWRNGGWQGNYLLVGSERTVIELPLGSISRAWDINDNNDIVGVVKVGASFHGFLYQNGKSTILDVDLPGAFDTRAFGISNNGSIVGTYVDPAGVHGFLMRADLGN